MFGEIYHEEKDQKLLRLNTGRHEAPDHSTTQSNSDSKKQGKKWFYLHSQTGNSSTQNSDLKSLEQEIDSTNVTQQTIKTPRAEDQNIELNVVGEDRPPDSPGGLLKVKQETPEENDDDSPSPDVIPTPSASACGIAP